MPAGNDLDALKSLKDSRDLMMREVGKVIIGQEPSIELLISLFARGHCLLVGVPGLAKTLLISTLAQALDLNFSRIQFTPDLMPSDITGTEIIEEDRSHRAARASASSRGRSSPTSCWPTRSTARRPRPRPRCCRRCRSTRSPSAGNTYQLDAPFFVLATQNPIEQEGTYPLPEAQLDRFMFNVRRGLPTRDEEQTHRRRDHDRRAAEPKCGSVLGARRSWSCRTGAPRAGRASTWSLRGAPGPRHAAPASPSAPELRAASGWPGAPARAPRSTWCSAPRRARCSRAAHAGHRGRARGGAARAAPPHRHQLHRRGRGHQGQAAGGATPERKVSEPIIPPPRLSRPEVVSRLKNMQLRARMVVEGFIAGLHKSPYHGFSVEFAEHRAYMPGDPLRNLDWKVYAKTIASPLSWFPPP